MISRGVFKPGRKLPSERELAAEFCVNRASLRQALKALVVMGVLRQRVGDGTYVTPRAHTILFGPGKTQRRHRGVTLADLFETLRIVEPELAARAAARGTNVDLARLESAVAAINAASLVTVDRETLVAVFVATTMVFRAIAPPGSYTSPTISPKVCADPALDASEITSLPLTAKPGSNPGWQSIDTPVPSDGRLQVAL
jgi:DNA-binding FadR family transcriptional regulator